MRGTAMRRLPTWCGFSRRLRNGSLEKSRPGSGEVDGEGASMPRRKGGGQVNQQRLAGLSERDPPAMAEQADTAYLAALVRVRLRQRGDCHLPLRLAQGDGVKPLALGREPDVLR